MRSAFYRHSRDFGLVRYGQDQKNLSPTSPACNCSPHRSGYACLRSYLINGASPPERVSNERDATTIYRTNVEDSAVLMG